MFGLLFNTLKTTSKCIDTVREIVDFSKNVFGNGTMDYVLPRNTTTNAQQLLNSASTLSFHNLTVPEGSTLTDVPYYTSSGTTASPGNHSPLFIKCSGTLTVNGNILALGGGKGGFPNTINDIRTPIPINIQTTTGTSADATTFTRLRNYGANETFFKFNTTNNSANFISYKTINNNSIATITNTTRNNGQMFFCGGGGAPASANAVANFGIACGGGSITSSFRTNLSGGGGGGFIALYYKQLIINGKEYGKESGCEIFRISANGSGGATTTTSTTRPAGHGGGCIIISANTLIIGANGGIHADGYGIPEAQDIGKEYSFLNNLPQLNPQQPGIFWNSTEKEYGYGINNDRVYYYDDGTGRGTCNQSIEAGTADYCGGAGIALGFKVK